MPNKQNAIAIPGWADEHLCKVLPILRQKGEGQHLEYMRQYPHQARDLGKEIAAFATNGGGKILIGVDDEGGLLGVLDLNVLSKRDELLRRIEGVARGIVTPAVTPIVNFAVECGHSIVIIHVLKGSQPVYYCEGRPYIRHLTESRAALPQEVIDQVLTWAGVAQSGEGIAVDESTEFYWKGHLDSILVNLIIALEEAPFLSLNPGPDHLRNEISLAARQMRDLIAEYLQGEEEISCTLQRLIDECDILNSILSHRHSETWNLLEQKRPSTLSMTKRIRGALIGESHLDEQSATEAIHIIKTVVHRLHTLLDRFDRIVGDGSSDDIFWEAGEQGRAILPLTFYRIGFLDAKEQDALKDAAMKLDLLPHQKQWYDSVGSQTNLKALIVEQSAIIERISAGLDNP